MTDRTDTIVALYDQHIRDAGTEVKASEAMEAILPKVAELIAEDERDINTEARNAIRTIVTSTRSKRANQLKRDLDWMLDGLNEDGVYIDPLMEHAYGLGRTDGADKTLRTWTAEDFQSLVVTRYRVAAESTKAASELDETVTSVLDRMSAAGAHTFGDVAWK